MIVLYSASPSRMRATSDVYRIEFFGETKQETGYFWGNIITRRNDKEWRWGGGEYR